MLCSSTFRPAVLPDFPKLKTFQFTQITLSQRVLPRQTTFAFLSRHPHRLIHRSDIIPSPLHRSGKWWFPEPPAPKTNNTHSGDVVCRSKFWLTERIIHVAGRSQKGHQFVVGWFLRLARDPRNGSERSSKAEPDSGESPRRKQKASKRKKEGEKKPEMDGRCSGFERGWGR